MNVYLCKEKNLALLIIITMLFSILPFASFAAPVVKGADQIATFSIGQSNYQVGGRNVEADVSPYIKDGRTMVPVAFVAPALGTDKATWIPENQMVRLTRGDDLIIITIGSEDLIVNGKTITMDTVAEIKDIGSGGGRTMLPISFIAKALGVGYQWNNESRSVDFYGYSESFAKEGTYGPATASETIAGNVVISKAGVRLQNKIIKGDLYIAESVGDGDVFLNNITVEGNTYVRGGGKNSIHINGGSYANVVIENTPEGGTRVVATNTEGINIVVATSRPGEVIILEGIFANVEVRSTNANVIIQGKTTIQNITINNTARVNVAEGTKVDTITLNAVATVTGEGTVSNANVNVSGTTVATEGTTIETGEGVEAPDTRPAETAPVVTPSTGDGGGSSSDDSDDDSIYLVTEIEVIASEDTITIDNGTLPMSAIITPTNASNKAVTWSVEAGTGTASISEDGLLTALTNGTVTVKATATDGSAKFGTKVITISNQLAPNQDQEAPTGLAGLAPTSASNDDGKITGTTTAMEYKLAIAEDAAYVTATDSEVAGLAAGDYVVRLAAKEGFNASPTTAVTVDVYLGADVTLSDLTVDGITIEGFNSDIFNYKVEVASGTIIVPTVAATVSAMGKSNAIVTATESLPGTTTVLVTAENGETQIYTVDFEEVIGIASIEGVTAPVAGKVPVKTVTETDQYIGVITWTPGDDLFGVELVYTAEITLEAKLGYTLTGVAENFFTVEGATATNEANKGIVTAVFPKTDYYLAGDSDFSGEEDGHFKYIGTASYVEIPNTIKGKEITSYKNMFAQTSVKGVKSSNPNIINMSYMFQRSETTTLDLRSFDTSNVVHMAVMFGNSQATTGYARTQADADNFNASSEKPTELIFTVR